jgi:hypothetical protein
MGNRRLSRKRLYQVEKLGQKVDLESGAGIEDCIKSATQHRQGQELITEIAIDLAPSGGHTILDGSSATNAIGKAAGSCAITQLTEAKFGIITEIRFVCVEAPLNGGAYGVDFEYGAAGKTQSQAPGTAAVADVNVVGEDKSDLLDDYDGDLDQAGTAKSLYICAGTTDGTPSGATMTAGKFLIYIHGFVAPDDL